MVEAELTSAAAMVAADISVAATPEVGVAVGAMADMEIGMGADISGEAVTGAALSGMWAGAGRLLVSVGQVGVTRVATGCPDIGARSGIRIMEDT